MAGTEILGIILTFALIAALLFGIIRKYHVVTLMFSLSLISFAIWTIFTGTSILGDSSSGSYFLDLFEMIYTVAKSSMSGAVLTVMSMMGYIAYMNHLQATNAFVKSVSGVVKGIKSPYVTAVITIILGAFIKVVIPSSSSMSALLSATFFPILFSVGVTPATAASALLLATAFVMGPTEPNSAMAYQFAGVESAQVDAFVAYQVPLAVIMFVVLMIVFPLVSKYFDKKEASLETERSDLNLDLEKPIECPKYYALLPILPMAFAVIFSKLVVGSVTISVVGACFLSFFISIIVEIIRKKSIKVVFQEAQSFYEGVGLYVARAGFIIVAGSMFGKAMTTFGGIATIVQSAVGGESAFTATIVMAVIGGFLVAIFSQLAPPFSIFAPIIGSVGASAGGNVVAGTVALIFGVGFGSSLFPVATAIVIMSGVSGVPITRILKRNAIPCIACVLVMLLATVLIYL